MAGRGGAGPVAGTRTTGTEQAANGNNMASANRNGPRSRSNWRRRTPRQVAGSLSSLRQIRTSRFCVPRRRTTTSVPLGCACFTGALIQMATTASNPSGGYPQFARTALEWMMLHPDLPVQQGPGEQNRPAERGHGDGE